MAPKRRWNKWAPGNYGGGSTANNATNKDEKNWRCPGCGNTGNWGWWTTCGKKDADGVACGLPRPPPTPPKDKPAAPAAAVAVPGAAPETGPNLAEARRQLKSLKDMFGDGHAFVRTQADLVLALETAAKANVSATERLQKLLTSQKTVESKVKQRGTAVDAAQTASEATTKRLGERLEELGESQAELRALKLDVAEASAALHAESTVQAPVSTPVQLIHQLVQSADKTAMASVGLTPSVLATLFQQLAAMVAVAANAAPPPPEPAPAPAPAPAPTPEVVVAPPP